MSSDIKISMWPTIDHTQCSIDLNQMTIIMCARTLAHNYI